MKEGIHIRASAEVKQQAQELAEAEGCTLSEWFRLAVKEAWKKMQKDKK